VIRAVFFDAGATLLHADPPVEEVYVREFTRDGVRATPERFREALVATWREIREKRLSNRYGGVSGESGFWEMFVNRARHHLDGQAISEECFGRLVRHFRRPDAWRVYPDAGPALDALGRRGYELGVISNWDSSLASLLEAHELAGRFRAVLISAVEETGKPGREIFERACARLRVSAQEAIHVGDSLEEDFEAARNAGLRAVLLDRENRHPEIPDRVGTLEDLPGLLGDTSGIARAGAR
jgi:putative hydrolase of the HAD superfamily